MIRLVPALLILSLATSASARLTVEVSNRSIIEGDDVQVTFTAGAQGEIELPSLRNDWNIKNQQQGTSVQIINGRVSRETTHTLILSPRRKGKLLIGPARLVRGTTLVAETEAITVFVRSVAAVKPSEALGIATASYSRMILVPEFQRDVYYVGEPLVAEWVLYVEQGRRISRPGIEDLSLPLLIVMASP